MRPAERQDLDGLLRLEQACYRGVYAPHRWVREQFVYYVRNPKARIAVCQQGDDYCGYVTAVISVRRRTTTALLLSVAVAPRFRRRRFGTALLDWTEEQCREAGCVAIDLEVAASRRATCRMYALRGYEYLGTRPDYYGPGADAVRMKKLLR